MNDRRTQETLEVVRAYHRAWTEARDFAAAARLLSDDLETDLPVNAYAGKPAFVDAITGFGNLISGSEVLSLCAQDGEAMSLYDIDLPPLGRLRIAEQFRVRDGAITFIRQVHDTATMRAVGWAPPVAGEPGAQSAA